MQFREQTNKIQVLAYRGYNKAKRRAEVKMLGSFDRFTYALSDGLLDALTEDERTELKAKIDEMKQAAAETSKRYTMSGSVSSLESAARLLDQGETFAEGVARLNTDRAARVWAALVALEKELEAAGHHRPKRAYKKRSEPATQTNGELPL